METVNIVFDFLVEFINYRASIDGVVVHEAVMGKLTMMLIAAAVSYVAGVLLAPDTKQPTLNDDKPTSPSTRGSMIPVLKGKRRLGAIIGWIGERQVIREETGGGGKKGGSKKKSYINIYYEKANHYICVGPADELTRIWQNGRVIWEGSVSRAASPEGTNISLGSEGNFTVRWGSRTQASGWDPYARDVLTIRWYKRLGQAPQWSSIDYEVTVKNRETTPIESQGGVDDWIDLRPVSALEAGESNVGGGTVSLPVASASSVAESWTLTCISTAGDGIFSVTGSVSGAQTNATVGVSYSNSLVDFLISDGAPNFAISDSFTFSVDVVDGFNPASMLYECLFAEYPFGLGARESDYNIDDLVSVGQFLDTEETPAHLYLGNGESWLSGVAAIMQDFGLVMGWDPVTGQHRFRNLRQNIETPVLIPAELLSYSQPETITMHHVESPDRTVYTFIDGNRNYKESTVVWSAESLLGDEIAPKDKKTPIKTVNSWGVAVKVSERRSQEDAAQSEALFITASRGALLLAPGQRFQMELSDGESTYLGGPYILLSNEPSFHEGTARLSAMTDTYTLGADAQAGANSGFEVLYNAEPDESVSYLEVPRGLNRDEYGVYMLRIRHDTTIDSAAILLSLDGGTTYDSVSDNRDAQITTGGSITADFLGGSTQVEVGPTVDLLGDDLDAIDNLDSDVNAWRSGRQIAIMGTEIMFLRSITPVSPTQFTMNGLIRGRYGTKVQDHSLGTAVYILDSESLTAIQGNYMIQGASLKFKAVPQTWNDALNPASVTPSTVVIEGGGYRPFSVENINTSNTANGRAWTAGTDLALDWNYRNADAAGAGAGEQLAGVAVSNQIAPEGTFTLQFLDSGDNLKRTVDNIAVGNYTYTNIDMVADFGGEPTSIKIKAYNILGGLASEVEEATIIRI